MLRWICIVTSRSRRRAADTRPSGEYANPEEVLASAVQHDMDGNWDEAVAIHAEVARRWPEHEPYARGRITQIEEERFKNGIPWTRLGGLPQTGL